MPDNSMPAGARHIDAIIKRMAKLLDGKLMKEFDCADM
jgi:hypothetical protein